MAHLVERSVNKPTSPTPRAVVLSVNSPGASSSSAFPDSRRAAPRRRNPSTPTSRNARLLGGRADLAIRRSHHGPRRLDRRGGAHRSGRDRSPERQGDLHALRGEFESTAQRTHHDATNLAGAMVDKQVNLPRYKRSGMVLTLNTDDAVRSGIAAGTAPNLPAPRSRSSALPRSVVTQSYTFAEQLVRFATGPVVSGLLLTTRDAGASHRGMQTLHGIARVIGVGAFALFFGTHVYAGFSKSSSSRSRCSG